MAPRPGTKSASLTAEELARLTVVVDRLGVKRAAKALRVGQATLDDATNGGLLAVETRNRLIASLAAVETDLEDGNDVG